LVRTLTHMKSGEDARAGRRRRSLEPLGGRVGHVSNAAARHRKELALEGRQRPHLGGRHAPNQGDDLLYN
jgi:hypothetical protein